jgi:hypothetical protein
MYVSVENCFALDKIIKSFEVAYRSYIVNEIKNKYSDLNSFSIAINRIDASFTQSSILLTPKYKGKIIKIKKEVKSNYQKITDCYDAYQAKQFNNDVLYVSEIIDYVVFFFNDFFNSLSNGFNSIEEFNSLNTNYNQVRNWLSHPASSKITLDDARSALNFIKKTSLNINNSFFWYVSNKELSEWIENLFVSFENSFLKFHNLSDVAFTHHILIEREEELKELRDFLFGKEVGYRKSGSVVIYGYGGVGKTALILEFLYRIVKEINDKSLSETLDFLLFFTSKEELLSYSETTKKLYIKDIRKQITSFEDFEEKLLETFNIKSTSEFQKLKGLVVIDNFETLNDTEKEKFFTFIKSNPRAIQFVVTSRNEEKCEDKINLIEFSSDVKGVNFINDYISYFNLKFNLTDFEKRRLLKLSKGNTLIIVLSLQLISQNYSIENIFNDLESIESGNIEIISDFMYKNTIDHAIDFLKLKGHNPTDILKVISLYDVPVDLYSLSKIAEVNVNSTEFVCEFLSTKLILEKTGETYKTNDFANKFIISKYIPNRIELKRLKEKIRQHQKELEAKLRHLQVARKKEPLLDGIMNDWKPKNSIDKIAISEAFGLFGKTKDFFKANTTNSTNNVEYEFEKIEKMTSHPYIKFQKARCFQWILKNKRPTLKEREELKTKISKFFEDAIDTTDFYYPYIKNTKSYASINWIYGIFLSSVVQDYSKSLRYLEDAVFIFKRLKIKDKAYFTAVNNLSWVYSKLYKDEKDVLYLNELRSLVDEVSKNKRFLFNIEFDYNLYMRNFGNLVSFHSVN